MAVKTNQKKKSHKKLWIILAVAAVVIIIAVILVIRAVGSFAEQMSTVMSQNTAQAELGEIAVITVGSGVVEASGSASKTLEYGVTLRSLYRQNGDRVTQGDVIAEFESLVADESVSALETQLSELEGLLSSTTKSGSTSITAPVSGRVKRIYAGKGDSVLTVQENEGALALLSADGRLKVSFETESDAVTGQPVQILYGEEALDGIIRETDGKHVTADFEDSNQYDIGVEVRVQTEDGAVFGSGVTECGHSVLIKGQSGLIKSVSIEENEKVSAGSTIFKLEDVAYSQDYLTLLEKREQLMNKLEDAREYQKGYQMIADRDGIITGLEAKEGDMVAAQSIFCKILDTSSYQVMLNIDELDIQGIEEGQQVEVTVDALEDQIFKGTVTGVSAAGENTEGVGAYQVRVLLEDTAELLPGMSANGKITVSMEENALLIPVDAIQTTDGIKSVTVVKQDGTTEKREIKLGLVNNENAQVLEGLSEGEQVQVVVKLEDIYSQMGITMQSTEE